MDLTNLLTGPQIRIEIIDRLVERGLFPPPRYRFGGERLWAEEDVLEWERELAKLEGVNSAEVPFGQRPSGPSF